MTRELEKKYYLRHKFLALTFSTLRAYLILDRDEYVLGSADFNEKRKTQFTKKEIEDIKNEFDVTLSDFELIEVGKWKN